MPSLRILTNSFKPTALQPPVPQMADSSSRRTSLASMKSLELPRLEVGLQFSDVQLLAENTSVKVYVARRLQTGGNVVLKCVHKETTKKADFLREFCYNYHLSSHPNIVKCFDEAFEASTCYVFTQELAPVGDLSKFVKRGGIGEMRAKCVVEQIAQALEFTHNNELVHRDVCLENIFLYDSEMSQVKLGDFGNTERVGAFVKKLKVRSPWAPPEVSLAVYNEGYYVHSAQDAWQLGILIFVCLTGSYPWSSADITDRHYKSWVAWLKRKTTKMPPRFKCFTPRLLRLLRRLLEPKPKKRVGVREAYKYLSDTWLVNENNSFGMMVDDKLSRILSESTHSLITRAEKKLFELLRSELHHPEPQPQKENRRRVRFSFDGDAEVMSDRKISVESSSSFLSLQ
ncbi:serine/threonine-protein kinase meng-po-like [Panulirus ornatus]|uniref:serine/threonine-protein kinase meng-po-like n=1 Tax=Panulirus ornatus TaxID=150431 RepID=UPI003A83E7A5